MVMKNNDLKLNETLLVVDGNSLMFRAFYALPLMTNKDGSYTNAVYGFFSMLLNAVDFLAPTHLAIAFDMKGKTFRHDMFEEYKGTRKPTPEELVPQIPLLKETLQTAGIKVLEKEGFEADDILGLLSKKSAEQHMSAVLLSGDKDLFQLVSDSCSVLLTRKGVSELDIINEEKLDEQYGLAPDQIVDLKGFMGDSSDNIPGVPGVGEKTALKLLHEYHTMDGVYQHIDDIKGKLKEKLEDNKDKAYLSRRLAQIDTGFDMDVPLDSLAFPGFSESNMQEAFKALGFGSLLKRLGFEKKTSREVSVERIEDQAGLKAALQSVSAKPPVAFYFGEAISFSNDVSTEYEVISEHSLLNVDFTPDIVISMLKPVLEDESIPKVLHGAKQNAAMLREYGVRPQNVLHDTKLAEYVIDPGAAKYEMDAMRSRYDAAGTAAAMLQIVPQQNSRIERDDLQRIYNDMEMPLMGVLLDMEETGFRIDLDLLSAFSGEMSANIDRITAEIYESCGFDDFNINSTKQLGEVLFERLGLPVVKKTKTGYSTDIEVLEKLSGKHPVIEKIIEYRRITKLFSTYIDGLRKIADKNGVVHTTFVQISTVTGRISSKEPNLQNIPIRTAEGREIRRLFVPSDPSRKLISADYSQIELRILAAISGDEVMKNAFAAGIDIHTRTASEVFNVAIDQVSPDMRRSAKAVNFGIVYGISDFGLARNLGIPVKKAAGYIERYFARFPGVKKYMDDIKALAKQQGFVTTLLGRRRYLPELKSKNYNVRSFGERAALNTPIQGTAADIIKIAMVDISEKLASGGFESRLILQVHDELIIDAVESEIDAVSRLLKDCMENAYALDVPLVADVAIGSNWLEAK